MLIQQKSIIGSAIALAILAAAGSVGIYWDAQKKLEASRVELEELKSQLAQPAPPPATTPFLDPVVAPADESSSDVPPAASDAPQLKAEPEILDLGTVSKAQGKVTGTFKLTNTGRAPLTIKSVLSSCGCTTAHVENEVVAPGETHNLSVTYDPNYFGDLEQGSVKKWIAIFSDAPKQSLYKVYLKANVVP